MIFPSTEPVIAQVTDHVVKLIKVLGKVEMSRPEIMDIMVLKHRLKGSEN
ncbi:hypothetical protein [Sphingobacterium haloxyli]|nr:hypothetical protein [Sphingobacterium haloxyli]